MKYCKVACVASVVVLLLAIGGLLLYHEDDGEEKLSQIISQMPSDTSIQSGDVQAELYEMLYAFAQVIYQYDTEERMFYEGAEEYMTQEAYQVLYPVVEEKDDTLQRIRMQSTLIDVNVYTHYKEETDVDVIMESRFSISQGANGFLMQYLKLSLQKQDGRWIITECSVIDTIED